MTVAPLLSVDAIDVYYDAIRAVKDVSLEVLPGEIVTLIGANGAGKSTTLKAVNGILSPRAGSIHFDGHDISATPAHEIARLGVSHSPEGRRIFPRMSVLENLEMGAFLRVDRDAVPGDIARCYELFPRLREREKQKAGTMSGGEQQMLAIARALMSRPRLLLLDEPSLGLAPVIVDDIYAIVREINAAGVAILLVEQNASYALEVSSRCYVLETGEVVLSGTSAELRDDDRIAAAYLGV